MLNSIIGDGSVAQAVKEANLGMRPAGEAGATRQGHLFGGGGGGGAGTGKAAAPKQEDRRQLAKRADELAQLGQKVQHLRCGAGSGRGWKRTRRQPLLPAAQCSGCAARLGVRPQALTPCLPARREMAARNAQDKLMIPQIRRALAEAQAQLAAAQQQHSASTKAIHDREKLKRMAKF